MARSSLAPSTDRLKAPWLADAAVEKVVAALGAQNCRFVGGAVRNTLLGEPVTDIDIATRLEPDAAMARLEAAGIKAVPTGIKHGTVTAVADGHAIEVTTLRHDVETFGRHAKVAFTDDWQADAARRDFTINALYAAPDGTLHDYFGGLDDLKAGHVRFIGDAEARITEDALRILRFFRFHAHYGEGGMDAAGLDACRALAGRLDILSVERVRDELLKLLAAPDPVPTLQAMHRAKVLRHVLPEFADFERVMILVDVARRLDRVDPIRRLAALLPQDPETVAHAAERLKLSNAQTKRLDAMAAAEPDVAPSMDDTALRQALYRYGAEPVIDRALLAATVDDVAALETLVRNAESWQRPTLPVTGVDLKALGYREGQGLGSTLKRLEEVWIESGFALSREALVARLDDADQP